jgi:uncharacterized phiE125 gp8 family phage protein
MKTTLVTAPADYPVSLDYVKDHLNIDHTNDDAYLEILLMSAVANVENITNRKLITQTWKAFLDEWPSEDYITLPFGKLQTVTSVKYKTQAGVETTVSSSDYIVDISSDPGRVVLAYNKTWPTDDLYPSNPIYIQFTCGYGATSDLDVPAPLMQAILLMIGDSYAHRESVVIGNAIMMAEVPGYITNLLASYRLWGGFND